MKHKKIPRNYLKAYQRGVHLGIKRGKLLAGAPKKAYSKIETTAQELSKERDATAFVPTDNRAVKWQGFVDAMNLIIASKR